MGKKKRLLSNMLILGAGTFASKVLVFLLMPLYTSVLSAAEFGVADILTQTANLLIPLAAVGICDGMFRFALDTRETGDTEAQKRIFSAGIIVILLGGAVMCALCQILRVFNVCNGYIMLIAAYVLCANLHSAVANFIRATGKTALFATQGILNTVLTIAFNVVFLVVFDMGTLGYVLSVVFSDLLVTVLLFFVTKLYRFISFRAINGKIMRDMLKFSIPYIPTTIMWLITSASDRYIVTAYCGNAENGLYAAAYKLPTLLTLVCGVFIEAWQFSVVKDADESEREGFFSTVYKNYMGIIFMGAAVIIGGSKILTRLLLADSYYESWQFVPVLVIATTFSALVSFFGSVYFLEKKSVMSMLTSMAGALVNVVLNFVLIPERGAMGAAVATVISYVAVYAIRAYDTRFYVRFNMHTVKLIINTLLVTAEAFIMISEMRYWRYATLAIMAFILVFNGKDILMALKPIAAKILKIKKWENSQKN
jgi:O-antigen/teichoic acid export membrane protein